MGIRPPEKSLYFSTTFQQPSKVVHFLSYFHLSAPSSPRLTFERAFEPSSYLFSSAPSSPRPSKVVHFLSYLHSSAPTRPRLIKKKIPCILPTGQITHYNVTNWAGNPLQYTITKKNLIFFSIIGQVAWNN